MAEELLQERGRTIPQFFVEAVENTFRSSQEGRPCFQDVEFVRLIIPGDRYNQPVQRVDDEIKQRFAKEYEAFKAGLETPLEGTPLSQWPRVTTSQVRELAHFHILTIEHLAGVNDIQIQALPMGARELRREAQTFLDVAKNGTAPIARLVEQNSRLEAENERLKAQMADIATRLETMEKANAGAGAD